MVNFHFIMLGISQSNDISQSVHKTKKKTRNCVDRMNLAYTFKYQNMLSIYQFKWDDCHVYIIPINVNNTIFDGHSIIGWVFCCLEWLKSLFNKIHKKLKFYSIITSVLKSEWRTDSQMLCYPSCPYVSNNFPSLSSS